jgi:flagellar motility protein MotE (MotC chaperone)
VSPAASVGGSGQSTAPTAAPVCAPTASELAKEAGLSPAELQVLQSLGTRRGQLDQREQSLDTQVQLIAAAEAKLDDRIKDMNSLKASIQDLLGQAASQQQAETDRLITVYEAMKPKDAAARMTLMDDSVRLPMAAKMKPRKLADILAQMPAEDAKNLTEKLAQRVDSSPAVTGAQAALNPAAAPPPSAPPAPMVANGAAAPDGSAQADTAPAKPVHTARAKPRAKPRAAKTAVAANDKPAAAEAGDTSAKTPPAAGAAAAKPG